MQAQHFRSWFNDYRSQATLMNERRLVLLSGSDEWALSLLQTIDLVRDTFLDIPKQTPQLAKKPSACFIYGNSKVLPPNIQYKRFRDKLGSESELIIFADSNMTVDAFAALSGTLKAGGIFFLVLPDIAKAQKQSYFQTRLLSLIQIMPNHRIISQSQESINVNEVTQTTTAPEQIQRYPLSCVTEEQYAAVQAIEKVVSGHRKRPLVLTADRGRGKSSALAIACAALLRANEQKDFSLVITAPERQSLSVFFRQLTNSLPNVSVNGDTFTFGKADLRFMPIDQLLIQPVKINLLLVDEAAAIPVYQLAELLNHYHRVVFSSTVHGYEGAGRGFTLKFKEVLNHVCPQWQSLHINQPIRWRDADPLEKLVFDACLLNAELIDISNIHVSNFACKVITASELVMNEALLSQVFSVLVTAHYQTKPSDLQLLLDNPQVQLVCLFSCTDQESKVIAVALLMTEGKTKELAPSDITAIKSSQRRLKNQFLPQSLLSHCGFEQAFDFHYLRIMRIAVHPELQQQGLGSQLLTEIQTLAELQHVDFIGTSFGVNESLLSFWLKAGFATTRIGFTKDKASGEHSALLLKAINSANKPWQKQLNHNFYRSFDYLLIEEYNSLTSELVLLLLQQQPQEMLVSLSELDIANVKAFASGERLFSTCAFSLYLWLKHDLLAQARLCEQRKKQVLILIARLIQKYDVATVCQQYQLTGKKMLNQSMKTYVESRLKAKR